MSDKLPKKIEQASEDAYYAFTGQELKPSLLKRLNPLYLIRHQKHLDIAHTLLDQNTCYVRFVELPRYFILYRKS